MQNALQQKREKAVEALEHFVKNSVSGQVLVKFNRGDIVHLSKTQDLI